MQDDYNAPSLDALLQEYGAPIADDGFSAQLMKTYTRHRRLRRILLGIAYLLGGLIAGSQISKLGRFIPDVTPNANLSIPDISALLLTWPGLAASIILLSFIFWLASEGLDGKI